MEYSERFISIGENESDIHKEHLERYLFAGDFVKEKEVLDIACGSGYGSEILKRKGAKNVVGVDVSSEAVSFAKKSFSQEGVDFVEMDGTDLQFQDESFDVVVSFETIEHIENYKKFISELRRVLKKEGTLILSTPNMKVTKALRIKNNFHVHEFELEELIGLISGEFREVKVYGQRKFIGESLFSRVMRKTYFVSKFLGVTELLKIIIGKKSQGKIGERVEGLEKNLKIEELEKGKEYMFIVIVAS